MSAVFSHTWLIDESIDLNDENAEYLNEEWGLSFGNQIEQDRLNTLQNLILDGKTILENFNITLNRSARTLERHREFSDLVTAEEREGWILEHLPTAAGAFSRESIEVQDDATLSSMGLPLGFHTI